MPHILKLHRAETRSHYKETTGANAPVVPIYIILLFKMDVTVDVIYAEAVVAVAFGAEAKFEVGIVSVGSAADLAFACVRFACLLLIILFRCLISNDRGIHLLIIAAPTGLNLGQPSRIGAWRRVPGGSPF